MEIGKSSESSREWRKP